jgi:hypothetical protein
VFFTGLDLLTSRYPRQASFLWMRSRSLYVYCLTYGVIAGAATALYPKLADAHILVIKGLGFGIPWVRALYIGLSGKALLHIRLATTNTDAPHPLPIGMETLVQPFEPALLRNMDVQADHEIRVYLQSRVEKYTDLHQVKTKIIENIPESLPDVERGAFEMDIRKRKNVYDCLAGCLKFLGKQSFERIFPI